MWRRIRPEIKILIRALTGLILLAVPVAAQERTEPEIRLVLQITVDGLRGDFLDRDRARLAEGGFRRLLEGGVVYTNAHYRHANTETIVGHTTLATGASPMLHGCARQAAKRFPDLPAVLGRLIEEHGNHVHLLREGLVSFPVEHGWMEVPDPRLIARSGRELRRLADRHPWPKIVVPRPGCGGGGLVWQEEVRPLLEEPFDGRFCVIHSGGAESCGAPRPESG